MQIIIKCEGLDHSKWMDQYISRKIARLYRYLTPSAKIQISIQEATEVLCRTTITIHNPNHNYVFSCDGENIHESFAGAMEKASRALADKRRRFKNRNFRRISQTREMTA
jgi:ribosomal subunit interface protein